MHTAFTRWVAFLGLLLISLGGCSQSHKAGVQGTVIAADSGFDVAKNGAAFGNFAGYVSSAVFDRDSARRLFGDQVCASLADGYCTPDPRSRPLDR